MLVFDYVCVYLCMNASHFDEYMCDSFTIL